MNAKNEAEWRELEKLARNTASIKPLSPQLRKQWDAAKRTGRKLGRGRPAKHPSEKSRIVLISIDPKLLAEIDKYAKSVGLSRSRLIAEGARLRMKV